MAINWNGTKVQNWNEMNENESEWLISQALIFSLCFIGIGTITDENWENVFHRINCFYLAGESTGMIKDGERHPFSPEDIHKRIGLSVNASPLTDAKFNKKVMEIMRDDSNYKIKSFKLSMTDA